MMRAVLLHMYELYLDDDRYAVPTLHLVPADDTSEALRAAQRMVAESAHHLGAEICLNGQRLAGIGSFAVRSVPAERRARRDTRG